MNIRNGSKTTKGACDGTAQEGRGGSIAETDRFALRRAALLRFEKQSYIVSYGK